MEICSAKKTKEHFDYVFNSFALVKVIPCNRKHIDKETLFCEKCFTLNTLGKTMKAQTSVTNTTLCQIRWGWGMHTFKIPSCISYWEHQ